MIYWCPKCGIVWYDADGPPLCRHNVLDPDMPPTRMEPLPAGHPYAQEQAA